MNEAGEKKVIKTWSRSSTIFPEMVGTSAFTTATARPGVCHRSMVGHKLSEFSPTQFRGHKASDKKGKR
jgi:small subunit ribosomal protein S19